MLETITAKHLARTIGTFLLVIQTLTLFCFPFLYQSLWKSSSYTEFWMEHYYLNYCCFHISHSWYCLIMRLLMASRVTFSRPWYHQMVQSTVWGWPNFDSSCLCSQCRFKHKNCNTKSWCCHNLNRLLTSCKSMQSYKWSIFRQPHLIHPL